MKNASFFVMIMLVSFSAYAQEICPTNNGDLKIYPIQHASMVWEWNDLTLYIDPVGDPAAYANFAAPDLVLITHSHGDHLSKLTLEGIHAESAPFIVPQEVADKMSEAFKSDLTILPNGEITEVLDMEIEAVPAYNYPVTETSHHKKGVGNGYIITIGGKRIYISGDTGNMPEMSEIKNIDRAFLCMNLPYTMDIDEAAKATLIINPKIVYPYHYRGTGGFSDLEKFTALVHDKNKDIEVRVLAWYPKAL
ncbi:MAG: MBL fold metallo-hydrolase [Bacteroidales bacterium]|nr:MBL fold metallo-hydrolase [Bacteroidales bacterium]